MDEKIVHKDKSYLILGCCFDVFNAIGPGHREKTYQSDLRGIFKSKGINFEEQVYAPVKVNGKTIAKNLTFCYLE